MDSKQASRAANLHIDIILVRPQLSDGFPFELGNRIVAGLAVGFTGGAILDRLIATFISAVRVAGLAGDLLGFLGAIFCVKNKNELLSRFSFSSLSFLAFSIREKCSIKPC